MSKIGVFKINLKEIFFPLILDRYNTSLNTPKISVNFNKIPFLVSFIFTLFGTKNESTHCILS